MSNDNILLITMGVTSKGLNSFTITGRNWVKLEQWMRLYKLDCNVYCDNSYYEIARNVTPRQRVNFINFYDLEKAQNFVLDWVFDTKEDWDQHEKDYNVCIVWGGEE